MVRKITKNFNFDTSSPAEYRDKIGKMFQNIIHHRRNKEFLCMSCYNSRAKTIQIDETCSCISGYSREPKSLRRVYGYANITEFPANDGAGQLLYKTGGEQNKIACYIYTTHENSKLMEIGDHFLLNNHGIIEELVISNIIPLSNGKRIPLGTKIETTSSTDKRMAENIKDYEQIL